MIKYPSIEQFRNVIRTVKTHHDFKGKDENGDPIYKHDSTYPTIRFTGTVKIHGTNAGVVKYKDRIEFQSRENVLSSTRDNAGFFTAMSLKNIDFLFEGVDFEDHVAVYGEWCGGSVQRGVAVSNLKEKIFVIFGYKVDGKWIDRVVHDNNQGIYHISQFQTFEIDIDFNDPQMVQNKLIEITEAVEKECPVGLHFGFSGIGEGVVWKSKDFPDLIFKVKGEKHSVTKVTKLAAVDTVMLESINQFVELALTENRLQQGISHLRENGLELTEKSTGQFLRWIVNDVVKEEQDTITKNGFDLKKINPVISGKARAWFFSEIASLA